MSKRFCKEEQIKLIMECRRSGLSDYQWCEQNGIHSGTFYNWVSKLRKKGYTFPESEAKAKAVPNIQDVVKVDFVPSLNPEPNQLMEQNVSHSVFDSGSSIAAELLIGNITLRFFNCADEHLIQTILRSIGGMNNAW